MPTVPTYSRQVKKAPLQLPRQQANASAASFGGVDAAQMGQMGQAVQGAGNDFERLGQKLQARESEARIRNLYGSAQDKFRVFKNTILKRQGGDALTVTEDTEKYLDELQKETLAGAKTPIEQQYLTQAMQQMRSQALDVAFVHQAKETERWRQQGLDGEISGAFTDGAEMVLSEKPESGFSKSSAQMNIIGDRIRKKYPGAPKALVDAEVEKFYSAYVLNNAQALEGKSASAALKYLDTMSDHVEKGQLAKVKNRLERFAEREKEADRENVLRSEALTLYSSGADMDELRKQVNKKYKDNDDAEFVWKVLASERNIEDAAEREREREYEDNAWNAVFEKPSFESIPAKVTPQTRIRMQSYISRKAAAFARGKADIETENAAYDQLNLLAGDNPEKFSQLNLKDYADRLSGSDFRKFSDLQRTIKTKASTGKDNYVRTVTPISFMNSALKSLEIEKDHDAATSYRRLFEDHLNATYDDENERGKVASLEATYDFLNTPMVIDRPWSIDWGTEPRWRVMLRKESGEEFTVKPASRPEGVPSSAKYDSGRKHKGRGVWTYSEGDYDYVATEDGTVIGKKPNTFVIKFSESHDPVTGELKEGHK